MWRGGNVWRQNWQNGGGIKQKLAHRQQRTLAAASVLHHHRCASASASSGMA